MKVVSSEATQGLMYHWFSGGNELTRGDGSVFHSYKTNSSKNINARSPLEALLISVPAKYNEKFRKSY